MPLLLYCAYFVFCEEVTHCSFDFSVILLCQSFERMMCFVVTRLLSNELLPARFVTVFSLRKDTVEHQV
jgi:hypothetical protein